MRRRLVGLLVVWLLTIALSGCGPEAGRPRGGGRGGDIGNRPAQVHPPSKFSPQAAPETSVYPSGAEGERP